MVHGLCVTAVAWVNVPLPPLLHLAGGDATNGKIALASRLRILRHVAMQGR
jgi:hypothetical protein